ncbi:NAD(P)-binding protein [Parathielavia hyrcaniae]|uniref:NAD(P)-binding protein n=1 Tax=Parathielavia hyrcaniae TaxID=113614 RepID=A0AAN6PQK9_9PEZI|nr:NAD(P)-binding protein [Parathielavia hyrcaniae]
MICPRDFAQHPAARSGGIAFRASWKNSVVRRSERNNIEGVSSGSRGFFDPWLVIDVLMRRSWFQGQHRIPIGGGHVSARDSCLMHADSVEYPTHDPQDQRMKKTVLITGCSHGGLGFHLAEAFLARGFYVFATLRDTAKAGPLANREEIDILQLDVTSAESVQSCAKTVEKKTGGSLDVLVNNAGAGFTLPLLDTPIDDAKQLYELNLWAPLAVTQAFAPLIIQATGVVCNISSVSSICNFAWAGKSGPATTLLTWQRTKSVIFHPPPGIYASSKSALNVPSETLRVEPQP